MSFPLSIATPSSLGLDVPSLDRLQELITRHLAEGRYPVVLTYGPYAKGLSFQDGNPGAWEHLTNNNPEVLEGSSNIYQSWELVDPEKWVPDGYAIVRVDSRGTGRSAKMSR